MPIKMHIHRLMHVVFLGGRCDGLPEETAAMTTLSRIASCALAVLILAAALFMTAGAWAAGTKEEACTILAYSAGGEATYLSDAAVIAHFGHEFVMNDIKRGIKAAIDKCAANKDDCVFADRASAEKIAGEILNRVDQAVKNGATPAEIAQDEYDRCVNGDSKGLNVKQPGSI